MSASPFYVYKSKYISTTDELSNVRKKQQYGFKSEILLFLDPVNVKIFPPKI